MPIFLVFFSLYLFLNKEIADISPQSPKNQTKTTTHELSFGLVCEAFSRK